MTIMSPGRNPKPNSDCANYCDLMHQLDEAFAGVAVGVGTAKLLGVLRLLT
jgi:Aspartyl protease